MTHLLLLETSGNQKYLFATNRLRENVGASELTWRAGTQWVLEAIAADGGPRLWSDEPHRLRENIRRGERLGGFEVILATSGKALILVDEPDKAKALVGAVTRRALRDAPGLDVAGAVLEYRSTQPVHPQVAEVHRLLNQVRHQRPDPLLRFQQLPITERCASSGLPAARIEKTLDGMQPFALPVLHKSAAREHWRERLLKILRHHGQEGRAAMWFPPNFEEVERRFADLEWLAVVHADGNGMGQTFLDFDRYCGCHGNPGKNTDYLRALRDFSLDLDTCTEVAFIDACATLPTKAIDVKGRAQRVYPIVPLVLGGDDLTVLVDGHYALAFAREFLRVFESETRKRLPPNQGGDPTRHGFGACAGVAIVKPHFPFHTAYELAESLLRSAKTVKKQEHLGPQSSALDFHVLFDASYTSLASIRHQLTTDGGATSLSAGPYVVSETAADQPGTWADDHALKGLADRVSAINARDPDSQRACLPNSQVHALRESLFQGRDRTDDHLRELMIRYEDRGMKQLCEGDAQPRSLFRKRGDGQHETRFLDALTSAPFWRDASRADAGEDGRYD